MSAEPAEATTSDAPHRGGLPPVVQTFGAIFGLLAAAAIGLFGGMELGERQSQPGSETLTVESPASAAPLEGLLRSAGGFTGFESGALGGTVTRTGVLSDVTSSGATSTLTIADGPATMTVQMTSATRLYRIESSTAPLAPGDVVVVMLAQSSEPIAVLRVPADLREGDAR